ncbi:MAG TPA: hypothetical protein VIE43_21625 [Thermoanaerobaculia bacterium]|jgi:hypothetical protein|nr:hypothetical protein [Thermoanaerobaculia bacterium]
MTAITPTPPRQVVFDPTPEIFATDTAGSFTFPLLVAGKAFLGTSAYDEVRFVFSIWHPSGQRTIDLDRAYVELRASFDPDEDHWTKIAEIEPVVPPYAGGESFDGWIVLPILGSTSAFAVVGSGFEPRARLQIRASAYFVA